jgi:hypothetical protein
MSLPLPPSPSIPPWRPPKLPLIPAVASYCQQRPAPALRFQLRCVGLASLRVDSVDQLDGFLVVEAIPAAVSATPATYAVSASVTYTAAIRAVLTSSRTTGIRTNFALPVATAKRVKASADTVVTNTNLTSRSQFPVGSMCEMEWLCTYANMLGPLATKDGSGEIKRLNQIPWPQCGYTKTGKRSSHFPKQYSMSDAGHYFLRIKSISLTMLYVAGPYNNINIIEGRSHFSLSCVERTKES